MRKQRVQEPKSITDYSENNVFRTGHGTCTYKFIVAVTASTRPAKRKQNLSVDASGVQEITPLAV